MSKKLLERHANEIEASIRRLGFPGKITEGRVTPHLVEFDFVHSKPISAPQIGRISDGLKRDFSAERLTVSRRGLKLHIEVLKDNTASLDVRTLLPGIIKGFGHPSPLGIIGFLGLEEQSLTPLMVHLTAKGCLSTLFRVSESFLSKELINGFLWSIPKLSEPVPVHFFILDPKKLIEEEVIENLSMAKEKPIRSFETGRAQLMNLLQSSKLSSPNRFVHSEFVVLVVVGLSEWVQDPKTVKILTELSELDQGSNMVVVGVNQLEQPIDDSISSLFLTRIIETGSKGIFAVEEPEERNFYGARFL